jgi:hypothetical protein
MNFWHENIRFNEKYYLLGIFFILVTIKSALTFFSFTPTVFIDEGLYDTVAQYIIRGTYFNAANYGAAFPPGYSIFISVAYLFSEDKIIIYHIMLIINNIISASIIFPSYFILKKYISQLHALLGAILISVLPAVTLFSFLLMSETLFICLTVFSIWFLIEAFENDTILFDFLAAISVFYLYLTRETGIAFIVAAISALVFFVLSSEKGTRFKVVHDKAVLIFSLVIPLLMWILYKIIALSSVSYYGMDIYIHTLIRFFSSPSLFESFSILMLHEIEYLIFSSYVIFFLLFIFIISGSLFKFKSFGFNDLLQEIPLRKVLALRSVIIYCLTFSAGLLVITVTFMQQWGGFTIYGRYIDPIVPVLFIFGIVGIGFLSTKTGPKWNSGLIFCAGVAVLFLSLYTLPQTFVDAFPNDFGIFYFIYLQNFIGNTLLMVLLLAIILIFIPWYLLKHSRKDKSLIAFFSFFIVLSVIFSVPIYEVRANYMITTEQVNQLGRYLQVHSSKDTQILMDSNGTNQKYYLSLTQFWTPGNIIKRSTVEDPSGVFTGEFVDKADYIISEKLLPYPCILASNMDYKLYEPHATNTVTPQVSLPFLMDMGSNSSCSVNGFYYSEGSYRWTREFSQIKINYPTENQSFLLQVKTGGERPQNNPANVTFSLNGHPIGVMNKTSGSEIFSAVIPEYYQEANYQVLGIRTNTWKPSDYGSTDMRNLGITVDWIRGEEISFGEMYETESWNSIPTRWMADNANLPVYADEGSTANLTFRASAFYRPRVLEIYGNERLRKTQQILPGDFMNVSVQIPLQKGMNTVRLLISDGCERPRDIPLLNSSDSRCLGIAVQNISFR